jgi:radical SAM modification target selenobiotic family peptide
MSDGGLQWPEACFSCPGRENNLISTNVKRRQMMGTKELKKLLASLGLAGLLAGAGLTAPAGTANAQQTA